jgi:peptidoglycan hydrolase-like protein with peptidoglycan-binding domain
VALSSARLKASRRLFQASENNPVLSAGEADKEAVSILQTCLIELGFVMPGSTQPSGLLDGVFGVETTRVVKDFQGQQGLKPDGIVGRQTLGKLDAIFEALVQNETADLTGDMNRLGKDYGIG